MDSTDLGRGGDARRTPASPFLSREAVRSSVLRWNRIALRGRGTFEFVRRGRGRRLLVLHPGGPGLTGHYLQNLLALAGPTRRVALFHPRGVGRSFSPRRASAYTLAALADDLEAFRRALGVDRIDLLGFSAGGFAALEYARRHPTHLRSLLLCGTAGSADDLRRANRQFLRAMTPIQRRALAELERRRAFTSTAYQRLVEEIERPFQSGHLRKPSAELAASRLSPRVYRAMMTRTGNEFVVDGTLARWDARPHLRSIRCPTLVLVGRDDFLYPASRGLAARIPGASFVPLARASHLANLERPREYRAVIARFLKRVERLEIRRAPATPLRARRAGRAPR